MQFSIRKIVNFSNEMGLLLNHGNQKLYCPTGRRSVEALVQTSLTGGQTVNQQKDTAEIRREQNNTELEELMQSVSL